MPAVSRLQKLHNVGVSLRAWRDAGVNIGDDTPHHIVDGQRRSVFKLIWRVVFHFCFLRMLRLDEVEREVLVLRKQHTSTVASSNGMEHDVWNVRQGYHWLCQSSTLDEIGKALLLSWCQAVCSLYGLLISDFSVSFADGKALCVLIHHYHPCMLSLDEIRLTTRDVGVHDHLSWDLAIQNEKWNSALAHKICSELGGIPYLVPTSDSTSVPDEKSMMVYACYLCSRLLASRGEVQACVRIQRCFRRHRLRRPDVRSMKAATVIIEVWRNRKATYFRNQQLRYSVAVRTIEGFIWLYFGNLRRMNAARVHRALAIRAAELMQVC